MKIINEINGNEAELTEPEILYVIRGLSIDLSECQKLNETRRLGMQAPIDNIARILKKFKGLLK